jgi:hypothetical protein
MPCASLGFQEHATTLFEKSKDLGIRVIKKDLGMVAGLPMLG